MNNNSNNSNDTILLVGHGSREQSGNDEILAFTELFRQRQPHWAIEVCFIEFSDITMSVGLAHAAQHAGRVLVVPLILNAAGHVKMDIPQAIDAARSRFPQTQFLYAPHLSACDAILAILKRRLRSAMQTLDMPDPKTTGVIVLGRGSSDRQANGEMAKMARWLMEETEHELVDLAFTGITYPRIERAVQRQSLLGMTQVVVLTYYLYNGTLVERISRQVEHLKAQYPQMRFISTPYFGFENEIFELLEQRIASLRTNVPEERMPCDGCKFRDFAVEHGLGGHHHDDAHTHDHDHAHPHSHEHELKIIPLHVQEHIQEHIHPHPHDHAHS